MSINDDFQGRQYQVFDGRTYVHSFGLIFFRIIYKCSLKVVTLNLNKKATFKNESGLSILYRIELFFFIVS